ncbi:MAG: tetratricopeptide repeat protein [Candidatus Eisenbacteria bacterium]|nr:tetratricopeptide repeat protein [Candidatus Eisenbacteria bacterium]
MSPIVRGLRPSLFAAVVLSLSAPLPAAGAVALPDTGLFAPVARQYRARLEAIRRAPEPAAPGVLRLLLATGQPDEAARRLAKLTGEPREADVMRARVALARQDFAALEPVRLRIMDGPMDREDERGALFSWRFATDDAAAIDELTRDAVAGRDDARAVPELLAAGRLAYDRLAYARAESCFTRVIAAVPRPADEPAWGSTASAQRAAALAGLGLVQQKRRDWDGSLVTLREALEAFGGPDVLMPLTETLIRLGRTDEAISAAEWAVALAPYNDAAHYLLGNGYARKNYTQLAAAYPRVFAGAAGRAALARADALLAGGRRDAARGAYAAIVRAHADWADARVRLASLDFEDGRFAESRDGCFAALRSCPEYGRAHAVLAKSLEGQRFVVDVHRAGYEARFAAAPTPEVPGIEKFVVNWRSLSPRHQKRVALSVAPWKAFLPVLIAGGSTYYIKPVYLLLSECPNLGTLRDQRINYDSRLWDDVRGCGGYHTVTGIEDVERTIFDRYNTVLHELTHQVHAMLPADDAREIQELYRRAKLRDDATKDGYLSRYAGGSVFEYFAEGANALYSPMRDEYDPREVVRERLERLDPNLRKLVERFLARTDVSASYPIAYTAGGDDRVERGKVAEAAPFYRKALAIEPANETALLSLSRALSLGNRAAAAESAATRAVAAHPASGPARTTLAFAHWQAGRGLAAARAGLAAARPLVRAEDRYLVDASLGALAWTAGDAPAALAAYDSVLAYQSDNPEGQQGRAEALALAGRTDEAVAQYERAVRMRTGVVELRCDYARDLLRAGRVEPARAQLAEAALLDAENPTAEALRAWCDLATGDLAKAGARAHQALAWGPWCDLAAIVNGAVERRLGRAGAAREAWAPVESRIASAAGPEYVYRPKLATWEQVHALPAAERAILEDFRR